MELKYLGITLNSYGKLETEVKDQIDKTKVVGYLNYTICTIYIHTYNTIPIYKTVIRSIMTNTAVIRPDTTKTKKMLEATLKREHKNKFRNKHII